MSTPDPLLRLPDEQIAIPSELEGEDRLYAVFEAVLDYVNLHAMAWPARDSGQLVPPPPEHVLHELAHQYELADEDDLLVRPRLGTVAIVPELPACDLCGEPARYDVLLRVGDREAGANICSDHYLEWGSGTLGASGDTYLMRSSEVPEEVRATCNEIRAAQGKEPIF